MDWLCLPRFDSGACFASLLGDQQHGGWLVCPHAEVRRTRRHYRQSLIDVGGNRGLPLEPSRHEGRAVVLTGLVVR